MAQLTPEGMERMGWTDVENAFVKLSDESKRDEVVDMLNGSYEGRLTASVFEESAVKETYKGIITVLMNSLMYAMYGVLLAFAAVIVGMVCKRSFIRERTDIGIYKSVGFTSGSLRMQFALRFTAVALIGAAAGGVISRLLSQPMLEYILRIVGLTSIEANKDPLGYIMPAAGIVLCFFTAAFISSRRVKSVEIRELVTE